MKNLVKTVSIILLTVLGMSACAQQKTDQKSNLEQKSIPKKESSLSMNKDTLDSKVMADFEKMQIERKLALTKEALKTIEETQLLLENVKNKKKSLAIKQAKELVGSLEVLLLKDPKLALIPVDVKYVKEEFVADIALTRKIVKSAQEAMNNGYYRQASDLLKDLRSEIIINSYMIPAATYPAVIKTAILMLEEDNLEGAEAVLEEVLNTIVIDKTVVPLPVLRAEQMIIESASIDKKNHENIDKVTNLLSNATYQLQLAEDLGYGKRDKEFASFYKSLKALETSVNSKENSESKFDKIKKDMKNFKDRLFPIK